MIEESGYDFDIRGYSQENTLFIENWIFEVN